jgi:hypothetical protein
MTGENAFLYALAVAIVACAAAARWCLAAWRADRSASPAVAEVLFGTLVTVLCVAVALLGLEVFYRFVYDATDSFALSKTSQRWFERHYEENSWHVRDDVDYQDARTSGRHRVTFLGDSFTNGHGVADVDRRFANLLRATHPEWEVHVLARDGLDTGAELTLLARKLGDGYQTDDLVLVYCLNDIGDLIPEWRRTVDALYAEQAGAGFFVRNSYAINFLYFRWRSRSSPEIMGYYPQLVAAYASPRWQVQSNRLRLLATLADAHGVHLSVVIFPFLQLLGPDYPFREAHARLDALWTALGVAHIDLLPVFAGHAPETLMVNRYDAHPNETAHALAAQAIDDLLRTPTDERQIPLRRSGELVLP